MVLVLVRFHTNSLFHLLWHFVTERNAYNAQAPINPLPRLAFPRGVVVIQHVSSETELTAQLNTVIVDKFTVEGFGRSPFDIED